MSHRRAGCRTDKVKDHRTARGHARQAREACARCAVEREADVKLTRFGGSSELCVKPFCIAGHSFCCFSGTCMRATHLPDHRCGDHRMTIRVLIVNDHRIVREGLRLVLSRYADIAVVGEAVDGHDALGQAGVLAPDVVLVDIFMPGLNGIAAARHLRAEHPRVRGVILTMDNDANDTRRLIEANLAGFAMKDAPLVRSRGGDGRAVRLGTEARYTSLWREPERPFYGAAATRWRTSKSPGRPISSHCPFAARWSSNVASVPLPCARSPRTYSARLMSAGS